MTAAYPDFDGTQLCAEIGTDPYFAETKTPNAEELLAAELCNGCAWVKPCLEYALYWKVEGTWGGTSFNQRKRIRTRRGIVGTPIVARELSERAATVKRLTAEGVPASVIADKLKITKRSVTRNRGVA